MPVYEYVCDEDKILLSLTMTFAQYDEATADLALCPECNTLMRRVFSFSRMTSMPEHFNRATGRYVTNTRDFRDTLKRQSETMTRRLGMEVNYEPIDPADQRAAFGITDEGIDDQLRRHTDLGWREVKKIL